MKKTILYLLLFFVWLPSKAQNADGYELYLNSKLIKTLAGNAFPLSFGSYGAGTYKVVAFKTDDLGNRKETICQEFTITERDKPVVRCLDTERCGPGEVTLSASGCDTYKWYKHNGTNYLPIDDALDAVLIQSIDKTTQYGVKGFTAAGCESDILPITATVNPLPGFTIQNGGVCSGSSAYDLMQLVTDSNNGIWSGPFVQSNQFLTASAETGKTYTLTYTETNENGCDRTESITFEVFDLPVIKWYDIPDLCDASPEINLSDYVQPSGGIWSGATILPSGVFSPSKAGEGTHIVTYAHTDKNGTTVSEERTIKVDAKATVTIPFEDVFTYDGATVTLTVPDFIPGVLYSWYDNGGEKIHEGIAYEVTAGKTPIVYTVRASHECIDYTGTVKVSSDLFPDFEPSTASKTIPLNTPVQFLANAYRDDYRYKWTFPETVLTLQDPFYAFHTPGDYSIKLNIENEQGGKIDKELPVTITPQKPEPSGNDFEITASVSQIVIRSKKEDTVSVRMIDDIGNTLYQTTAKINIGENRIILPILNIHSEGTGLYIYTNFKNADYQTFTTVQP